MQFFKDGFISKGVLELVEIWRLVVNQRPKALLAIIGDGQLEHELKEKIRNLNYKKILFCLDLKAEKKNMKFLNNQK